MGEDNRLDEEALKAVSGGTGSTFDDSQKKNEFESAWIMLQLDAKDYSGSVKSIYFDEWQENNYPGTAESFLRSKTNQTSARLRTTGSSGQDRTRLFED